MQLGIGLDNVPEEPRRFAGARHGMPLIADAAGVEHQGIALVRRVRCLTRCDRDEPRPARGGEEAPVAEHARRALRRIAADRPLHGGQRLVLLIGEPRQAADIEIARALILEPGQGGMLAENIGGPFIQEGIGESHTPRDLGHDPPIRPGLARRREEGALPRDPPFGIGHGALALAPRLRRQQHVRVGTGIGPALAV